MLNKINVNHREQILIITIALVVVTLAVFWQVNQYDFVFDDIAYATGNSHIRSGITIEGIRWAFSTRYADLWNPLLWLSFMADYQLYGLNAGAYHMTNLVLHILSTLLLFWLFNRMTGTVWKSAFVAALFAIHPLHVESVAWVAERKDVLSAFFWMLTLCLYVYYTEKPAVKRYLFVLASFALALMSKPMVITLPAIMILLDYWPLKRFEAKKDNLLLWQLKEKIPFFVLSAITIIILFYNPDAQETSLKGLPLSSRLANAPVAFVTYLIKTFWPHDMAVLYPFPSHIPIWQIVSATLLIMVISASVIAIVKRLPYLFVGWIWFVVTILPVIGIIQISLSAPYAMADRYHYLPSIGLSMMLAWGIPLLFPRESRRKTILLPVGTVFLAIMALLAWQQCGYWKNSLTLFSHALQVTKDNYVAHDYVGLGLFAEGKNKEALEHFNNAIRIKPDYFVTYNNRGMLYGKLAQHQQSIENFNKAISILPTFVNAYYNRGLTYSNLGQHLQAIRDYSKAIDLNPAYIKAYNNRGISYVNLGRYQLAVKDFTEAIKLKPDYTEAYYNRGVAYHKIGQNQRANEDLTKSRRLSHQ